MRLRDGATISVPDDPVVVENAAFIAGVILETTGLRLEVAEGGGADAAVILEFVETSELRSRIDDARALSPTSLDESYLLRVGPDAVHIRAHSPSGLYYGLVTFWQLLASDDGGAGVLAGRIIADAPTFRWRGLMLDSARHMQSPDFIVRYIDWMSLHKLNVFHWHLTDDQAWRLQIMKYPKLTDVGAWRVPAGAAPAEDIDPLTGRPRLYGGYYSQEEIREIVAHAAKRHVTIVPEIDVPGHATAAIAAYPELGVDGVRIDAVPANWGIYDNVFNLEESTFVFLEDVLREVVDLFPGEFVHLGGDEVVTRQWEESPRVQERMAELGLDDTQAVQNYYVERLQGFLARFDRRVIGWDEIVESELPREAAVMSWRGIDGAIAAAAKGHETVLSPAPTFYLDHVQTAAADAPPGRGGIVTVRDIHAFDPLPEALAGKREFVLGLQANVWTEHIRTEDRVAYMTWPRAAAVAEIAWAAPASPDWDAFAARLRVHAKRLSQLGVPLAPLPGALVSKESAARPDTNRREDRELELCSRRIELALEDDAPLDGERESYLLDIMDPCWLYRDADLRGDLTLRASVGQVPFNFEIGELVDEVVVVPAATRYGELNVHLGSCEGPLLAALSLEPAHGSHAATVLPPATIGIPEDAPESADLCLRFARHGIDPIWAIDWVELSREGGPP